MKLLQVISAYVYRPRSGANLKPCQKVYKALGESILQYTCIICIASNVSHGTHYMW